MYWNNVIDFYNYYFYFMLFITISYIPLVIILVHLMKNKKPLHIKNIMFSWNLLISIFSIYCVNYITIPLYNNSLFLTKTSICTDIIATNSIKLSTWRFYFILSKFPEMIDTLWIILKKKQLSVLHLWHHLTVSIYCWILVYSTEFNEGGQGTYFAAMNSFVHTIMYLYYTIVTKSQFRSNTIARSITLLQIIQMFIGISIHIYRSFNCDCKYLLELYSGYIIYGSYFYLFLRYYYYRYIVN